MGRQRARPARGKIGVGPDCWAKLLYELDLCINLQKIGPRRIGKVGKSRLLGFPEADPFEFAVSGLRRAQWA